MSWRQQLVNAQTDVNRCVWAMNAAPLPECFDGVEANRQEYVLQHVRDAIAELERVRASLEPQAELPL